MDTRRPLSVDKCSCPQVEVGSRLQPEAGGEQDEAADYMTTGNVIGEYSLVTRSPMAHSVRAFTQLKVYNSRRLLSLLFSLPPFNCAIHRAGAGDEAGSIILRCCWSSCAQEGTQ